MPVGSLYKRRQRYAGIHRWATMRQVRFRDPAGTVRTGEWLDGNESGEGVRFADRRYTIDEVDVLAPCEPTKIVCIGRNYADHAAERGSDVPERPLLFLKGSNTVSSHGTTVTLPGGKEVIEHEAELAVVIGKQCKAVPEREAMDVVRGFACGNDLSNRDDQRVEQNWIRGKAFDNAAPLGPAVVPPEDVPADAAIRLRVNGEKRQHGSRADMIFSVPELIAEITTYMTLEPGDVILTGTPEGVGPLADGDEIDIEIDGIGTLSHSVSIP
jgi:2-keto-4-pentenoate hydratase/2-oxohepta-3-ene-1,7-dioic acid hydratase in catechol pathway